MYLKMFQRISIRKTLCVQQPSSIVIVTLMFLSIISLLTQQLVRSSMIERTFDTSLAAREAARMLALSGIEIAVAQLSMSDNEKNAKREEYVPYTGSNAATQRFLITVLPVLNRWQTFALTEKIDGIDGAVHIRLSAERGKIDINKSFDRTKKQFDTATRKLLESVTISGEGKTLGRGAFLEKLEAFLAARGELTDIAELYGIDDLAKLPFATRFGEPSLKDSKSPVKESLPLVLADLFTVYNTDKCVDPWLFSPQLIALTGAQDLRMVDEKTLKEKVLKAIEKYDPKLGSQWVKNWPILEPLRGKLSKQLQGNNGILAAEFAPSAYTVVSCGTSRGEKQQLLAILIPQKKGGKTAYCCARIYWI